LGAVYSPLVLIVPTVALPPATPFTCQVTAVFVVPVTVAVNWSVAPGLTVEEAPVTVTVICGGTDGYPPPQETIGSATKRSRKRKRVRPITHTSASKFSGEASVYLIANLLPYQSTGAMLYAPFRGAQRRGILAASLRHAKPMEAIKAGRVCAGLTRPGWSKASRDCSLRLEWQLTGGRASLAPRRPPRRSGRPACARLPSLA
jgi:hypothetical protein